MAVKKLAKKVEDKRLLTDDITNKDLAAELCLSDAPDPDLFIRTGGEQRISNFLLWQIAYAELVFTDVLWPDYGEIEMQQALEAFQNRQRRYGQTADQIKSVS